MAYTQSTGIMLPIASYADTQEWYSGINSFAETLMRAYIPPNEKTIIAETDYYVSSLRDLRSKEENDVLRITGFDSADDAVSYYEFEAAESLNYGSLNYDLDQSQLIKSILERMLEDGKITDPIYRYQVQRLNEINEKYTALIDDAAAYVSDQYSQIKAAAIKDIEKETTYLYLILHGNDVLQTNLEAPDPKKYFDSADNIYYTVLNSEGEMVYSGSQTQAASVEVVRREAAYDKAGGDSYTIYVQMRPEAYMRAQINYRARYNEYRIGAVLTVLLITAAMFCFVWLIRKAGVTENGEVKLNKFDRIYLDAGFVLMLIGNMILAAAAAHLLSAYYVWKSVSELDPLIIFGCVAISAAMTGITLLWAMSLSRRTKLHCAAHYTLIYKVFENIKIRYDKSSLRVQGVAVFTLYILIGLGIAAFGITALLIFNDAALVLLALVFALIYIICSLNFIFGKSAQVAELEKGVDEIKNGNLNYLIPLEGTGAIENIAQGVNNIAEGLSYAVGKEVKSAQFKTELITNISHDLKTPLTSILTYIDLLKKESDLPANALNYIDILDKKSARLKTLTDDLFDAAKAASGDMAVNIETMDLIQFLDQALAEMQDNIEASGLIFISNIEEDKAIISADGKLLFRVISNIVDNVIKYAMKGSRVYISLEELKEEYCLTVKNISKEELNITEEELMERFVRGDSSRNTDGSGLGLSIAKDFMQLMDGKFIIEIDGDLFKAKVYIPKAAETDFTKPEGDNE